MLLHKGETLFRQGESGPLYQVRKGLLKIVRVHEDGSPFLMNIIVADEIIPHHSLVSPNAYHGTAIALVTCEIDVISPNEWYQAVAQDPAKSREIALLLQDKLRMMQQRIDQLTQITPLDKIMKLQQWLEKLIFPAVLTDVLTQDEIGQLIGLRRETVNRILRSQSSRLPAGPKNS
ncbi:Crp/Fnr family transcriptional regulator [Paenibacillus lutrae]|uniref:Cyclic nucleotide-binding domain-containing protein n=1 Tax=Paenibacillus lutrae TaxID=2078573 RepID=A0A7X3FM77_9BACL|nr:Crp/Fnr family transcriptional regulator [Paenibacillus lutrae]MVP02059.1 cyclic nucleotide-binding domain-containing protein [Paenibacillus lutrae]